MPPNWRVLTTVGALTAFGLAALVYGQTELAALAGGALAGYLGRVNGHAEATNSTP